MYIGSIDPKTESLWLPDEKFGNLTQREVTYVPALCKLFDEVNNMRTLFVFWPSSIRQLSPLQVLVNAADNKQRDKKMTRIDVTIKQDDGRGGMRNACRL